jgi:hypothetical protein
MGTDPPWLCYPGINVKELSSQLSSCCHQEYELGGGSAEQSVIVYLELASGAFFRRQLFSLAPVSSSVIVFLRQLSLTVYVPS